MYVQLYITVGLKEIPKGNGGGGGPPLGAWASADSRRGWGSRPRDHDPSKERKYGPARIRCFQKRKKNRMSEIVCWNLSWLARISQPPMIYTMYYPYTFFWGGDTHYKIAITCNEMHLVYELV